jgi:predicted  nucleic acid-binding Zn-ribbon protein
MKELIDLEQRIALALERVGRAIESLGQMPAPQPAADPADLRAAQHEAEAASAHAARLTEALETERDANAQLTERVRAIRERQDATVATLEARLAATVAQLDAQGIELQRMRMVNVQLRETVRSLREAAEAGTTDPHLINKAMMAELEALRTSRLAEISELDDILTQLDPILAKEAPDART